MKPLRFGIVGCGGISNLHAVCLQKLAEEGQAVLVAGAEPNESRRLAWGEKWGVPTYETLAELLERDDLDVVTVCTPSGMHADNCIEIARSGRNVLCEKPMDVLLEKVDDAIAAAKESGVVLGGIFQQRFPVGVQKVKRAIEGGYFGDIVFVHSETPWYRSQGYYSNDAWRGTWELDGGVLSNQAPHMIDRMIWLGGDVEEVLSATCQTGYRREIEAETVAVATVRLRNGALGTITGTTLAYDGLPQRVLICGTEGSAAFSGDDLVNFKTVRPFEADAPAAAPAAAPATNVASQPLSLGQDLHRQNILDYVTAVRENRAPLVTGEEQRKVVRTLNLIYAKAGVGPYAGA